MKKEPSIPSHHAASPLQTSLSKGTFFVAVLAVSDQLLTPHSLFGIKWRGWEGLTVHRVWGFQCISLDIGLYFLWSHTRLCERTIKTTVI